MNFPAAVTKAYDLLLWLIGHVGKISALVPVRLATGFEARMLTVLELLILAAPREIGPSVQAKTNGGKV